MALRVTNNDPLSRRSSRSRSFNSEGRPGAPEGQNLWNTINSWANSNRGNSSTPYRATEDNNFFTDVGRNLGNFFGPVLGPGTAHGLGTGFGDFLIGSDPNNQPRARVNGLSRSRTFRDPEPETGSGLDSTNLPSFLSSLMEALGYVDSSYEAPTISYDPLRNEARGRAGEYDARLNAMYNQLSNSIRDDGEGIQENYQGAIDSNAQRALDTQANIQSASDVADSRNAEVLAALGLGEAQGNIIDEGRDLNTQTAANVADAAARGQISGDALTQNQQSAGAHNANLVGAAGLEGNLQRSRVQSELAQLLAQYDMEEQQANQQAQMQAQQQRSNGLAQAIGLAGNLYSSDWDSQRYQDELAQAIYEQQAGQNQPNKLDQSMSFLQQLMQSPQFADQDIEAILPYITALGGVGKLL